jgi:hypothetical protein
MADKLMRAQVTIPLDDAVPENYIVNTLYFDGDDTLGVQPVEDYHAAVETLLTNFYQAIDGVVLAPSVAANALVKIYDMRDPEERVPEHEFTIALTPAAGIALPNEVALCLSFRAEYESGVNPQRRRGRIYLGPVSSDTVTTVAGQSRPLGSVQTAVAAAADAMADGELINIGDPERVRWSIYSPTTDATQDIGLAFNDVIGGWVDNAYDTQRRRGPAPTSRATF